MTTNFGGVDVVPWQGAIADDQLWGSGRGAIAGCHCAVLWLGGGIFFYIDSTKLVFAIWGLCWSNPVFFPDVKSVCWFLLHL